MTLPASSRLRSVFILVFAMVLVRPAVGQGATGLSGVLSLPPGERPVRVDAAFVLHDINEIDDEGETFEFTGRLSLTWRDPRQAFDPNDAGVSEMIFHGDYQFNEIAPAWYPQVVLANASGLMERDGVLLRISPDGTCRLVSMVNAVAETSLDLSLYPFDTQRLDAVFEILGFDASEVVLRHVGDDGGSTRPSMRVPQFRIASVTFTEGVSDMTGGEASSSLRMTVVAKRQPFFMLRLVAAPLALITMLSWSVFWMEKSALGDRMAVSFVGVLTAVAYQVVVGEIMPHIAYPTILNAFISVSFLVMCATVLVNLRVGALDKRGLTAKGDAIDRRNRWIFPVSYLGLTGLTSALVLLTR